MKHDFEIWICVQKFISFSLLLNKPSLFFMAQHSPVEQGLPII
jgi:hypothetical protein